MVQIQQIISWYKKQLGDNLLIEQFAETKFLEIIYTKNLNVCDKVIKGIGIICVICHFNPLSILINLSILTYIHILRTIILFRPLTQPCHYLNCLTLRSWCWVKFDPAIHSWNALCSIKKIFLSSCGWEWINWVFKNFIITDSFFSSLSNFNSV